jgi:ATP-dependent Clp protease protease subunit
VDSIQTKIENKFLKARKISLVGRVDEESTTHVIDQMLYLNSMSKDDISLVIRSPGGICYHGLGIYDIMQLVESDIKTFCIGYAMSMGAVLLASGTKGKRYATKNSMILIHQPYTYISGTVTDAEIDMKNSIRLKKQINTILAKHTGKTLKDIEKAVDRDKYLIPTEAKKFGIIDHII